MKPEGEHRHADDSMDWWHHDGCGGDRRDGQQAFQVISLIFWLFASAEEFLALDPADQQRVAYWVDGFATAKDKAAMDTVAFDKFGQPIAALVEDCKATPEETLWQKLKKHL
jgi:hypothetical protein